MLSTRNLFQIQNTSTLEVNGWKEIFQADNNEKKVRVTVLISNKRAFKTKIIGRQSMTLYNDKKISP